MYIECITNMHPGFIALTSIYVSIKLKGDVVLPRIGFCPSSNVVQKHFKEINTSVYVL